MKESKGFIGRKLAPAHEELEKLEPINILHDEKEMCLNFEYIDERHDIRMIQELQDGYFAPHLSFERRFAVQKVFSNDFDGDNLSSIAIASKFDFSR
jgi:hypothetical protein